MVVSDRLIRRNLFVGALVSGSRGMGFLYHSAWPMTERKELTALSVGCSDELWATAANCIFTTRYEQTSNPRNLVSRSILLVCWLLIEDGNDRRILIR